MRRTVIALVVAAGLALGVAGQSTAAAPHHSHRAPNTMEFAELGEAVYAGGKGCHLEWDGVWVAARHGHRAHWADAQFEAICQG